MNTTPPWPAIKKSLPSFITFAVFLGGIALLFHYFDAKTLGGYVERAGIWAPLALIAVKASTIVIAPLGGAPLYPLAGALFGFWGGVLYLMIGDAIGASISFWLSRIYGRRIVNHFFPDNETIRRVLHAFGTFRGFLVGRVALIALPELISYAAGLTRIRFLTFFIVFNVIEIFPTALLAAIGTFLTQSNGSFIYTALLVLGAFVCGGGMFLFANHMKSQDPDLRQIDVK